MKGERTASGPVDLRLLLPALAGWGAAFWATAQGPAAATVAAVVTGALAAGSALALRRRRGVSGILEAPRRRVVVAGILAVAVASWVLACAAFRSTSRASGPMPEWIRQQALADLQGQLTGDPRAVASGRFPAPPRVAVPVRVRVAHVAGRRVAVSQPMLVLAPAGGGPGSWAAVTAGQRVSFRGRLCPTEPGSEPVALVSARTAPQRILPGGWPWRVADRVRAGLRAACADLGPDSAGLLPSLVVGDTAALPDRLEADLKAAGLTHLTAVSGANVAIVVGAVTWAAVGMGAVRQVRVTVAVLSVAGFVVLARPSPSVLRAAVMASVALAGLASARRPRGVPLLAGAVILLLGWDPWLGRNPGFALSVAATAGLLLLAPAWTDRLAGRMPRPLATALAAPAAAQAACGPILVLLAPSLSLVAVPANLLAEPAVAPATLFGVTAAVLSQIWPLGARWLAWSGSLGTDWIALVAHRGAAMPLAAVPWPGGLGGAILLAGLTSAVVGLTVRPALSDGPGSEPDSEPSGRGRSRGRGRSPGLRTVLVLALAVLVGWLWLPAAGRWLPLPGGRGPRAWSAVLCDVGQGDALIVRSGADRAVLVDTGPDPKVVDRCLHRFGVHHLDLVVITHLHADHALGLPGALHRRDVAGIWVSPLAQPASTADAVRRWALAAGTQPVQAWAGARGSARRDGWTVVWRVLEPRLPPEASGDPDAPDGTAVNESSVVLLIDIVGPAGRIRVLDLADLETGRQQGLAQRMRHGGDTLDGPVDVVKVAHHGSARQAGALYASCGARLGLISVGTGNDYGHPAGKTLGMLARTGIRVVRTDEGGDLVVDRSRQGLRVRATGK